MIRVKGCVSNLGTAAWKPSFPLPRESSLPAWLMDSRFRGNDDGVPHPYKGFLPAAVAKTLPYGAISVFLQQN